MRIGTSFLAIVALFPFAAGFNGRLAQGDDTGRRPNILWLTCEDMSLTLGCFGDQDARTPNLDRLAGEGVRYTHAFSTSGVCAPSRSCLITGVYPSSLGTQFMRCQGTLPEFVRCFPEYLRGAGYYCTNNVKTDYNFSLPPTAWDESSRSAHWSNRPPGMPFFAVFNNTVTHESQLRLRGADFEKIVRTLPTAARHDPSRVTLPPFHPDTPEARRDRAQHLDTIAVMDQWVGEHLARLDAEKLADDTIVFFFSDHGVGLPRAKRWLYDSGTHVPLIVRFGRNFRHLAPAAAGEATDRLVSFIDFAPTVLSLARVDIPDHMQGEAFLGQKQTAPREYVYGIRDRMDETHDLIRSVRDARFKYIRNFMPWIPYAQPLTYAEEGPTLQSMRQLHAEGTLSGAPALFFRPEKPPEELFDTASDPNELVNLADRPEHRETLKRLRRVQEEWGAATLDLGLIPEPDLHARCDPLAPYLVARRNPPSFPLQRIRDAALAIQNPELQARELTGLLNDPDPAIRFWGVLGCQARARREPKGGSSLPVEALRRRLADEAPVVRVAAARALLQFGDEPAPLQTLVDELEQGADWTRHHAALGLLELGPRAAPARRSLETALNDRNEYVVRVAKRALQGLKER